MSILKRHQQGLAEVAVRVLAGMADDMDLNLPMSINPEQEGRPNDDLRAFPPAALGNPDMTDRTLEELQEPDNHDHHYYRQGEVDPQDAQLAMDLARQMVRLIYGGDVRLAEAALQGVVSTTIWYQAVKEWVEAEGADVNKHPSPPRDEKNKNHGDGRDAPDPDEEGPGPVPVVDPKSASAAAEPCVEESDMDKLLSLAKAMVETLTTLTASAGSGEHPLPEPTATPNGMNTTSPDPKESNTPPHPDPMHTTPVPQDLVTFPEGKTEPGFKPKSDPMHTTPVPLDSETFPALAAYSDLGTDLPLGPQSEEWKRHNPAGRQNLQPADAMTPGMPDLDAGEMCQLADLGRAPWDYERADDGKLIIPYVFQATDTHVRDVEARSQMAEFYAKQFGSHQQIADFVRQVGYFRQARNGMSDLKACVSHGEPDRQYAKTVFQHAHSQMRNSLNRVGRSFKRPGVAVDEAAYLEFCAVQADCNGPETQAHLAVYRPDAAVTAAASTDGPQQAQGDGMTNKDLQEAVKLTLAMAARQMIGTDPQAICDNITELAQSDPTERLVMAKMVAKMGTVPAALAVPARPQTAALAGSQPATEGDRDAAFSNLVAVHLQETVRPQGEVGSKMPNFAKMLTAASNRHNGGMLNGNNPF